MTGDKPRAVRPAHVKPDPRTDAVNDFGQYDLDPPSEEEIRAGVDYDRELREYEGDATDAPPRRRKPQAE